MCVPENKSSSSLLTSLFAFLRTLRILHIAVAAYLETLGLTALLIVVDMEQSGLQTIPNVVYSMTYDTCWLVSDQ